MTVNPETQKEKELVAFENVVFEDAYKRGIITKEQRDEALALQRKRLADEEGVPVTAQPSPMTTAYLGSKDPFLQKDVGAVILPQHGLIYKGEFYQVDVPKHMMITGVERGEPVVDVVKTAEGEVTTTSTPLTLTFVMDPSYKPPPVPTEPLFNIPSGFTDVIESQNPILQSIKKTVSQESRARGYAKETGLPVETARQLVIQADLQQTLVKASLVGGIVSFAVAPTAAVIGAGTSVAISQAFKGVTKGELLTAEELAFSAGVGATFSVAGSVITGAATSKFPVLAEQTVKGAVSRIGFGTALGASGGAAISATETALMGGTPEQIAVAAGSGAVLGGAVGAGITTGAEVFNVAVPWIARRYQGLKTSISPEGERGLSFGDRLRGVLKPEEAAMYRRVSPLTETKPPSIFQRIEGYLRPDSALYKRVTGTSPTDVSTVWKPSFFKGEWKPTSRTDTFYSGGKFVPFEGGKGGLSSVLIVKQKPVIAKTTVKPFPVQTAAWTSGLKKVEAKTVTKTEEVVADVKTVLKKKPKVESTLAGTAEVVGYNPMQYQGPTFPIGKRGKKREEVETVILDYPESGLSHPIKLGEVLNISKIEDVGAKQQGLGVLATEKAVKGLVGLEPAKASLLDTKLSAVPASLTEMKGVPLVGTKTITETAQQYDTEQIVEQITEGLQTQKPSLKFQVPSLEVHLPSGLGGAKVAKRGVGYQKRVYPIVTGADILKSYLKGTKKAKSKGGYKTRRGKKK